MIDPNFVIIGGKFIPAEMYDIERCRPMFETVAVVKLTKTVMKAFIREDGSTGFKETDILEIIFPGEHDVKAIEEECWNAYPHAAAVGVSIREKLK